MPDERPLPAAHAWLPQRRRSQIGLRRTQLLAGRALGIRILCERLYFAVCLIELVVAKRLCRARCEEDGGDRGSHQKIAAVFN